MNKLLVNWETTCSSVSGEHTLVTMGCGASSPQHPLTVKAKSPGVNIDHTSYSDKEPLLDRRRRDDIITHNVQVAFSSKVVQTDKREPKPDLVAALAQAQRLDYKANAGSQKVPAKDGVGVEDVWLQVDKKWKANPNPNLVVKRSGWKTVRLFVSSTFKDFHYEREVLVKEVFPELRAWCELNRLHLVECDLRWGVPEYSTSEVTLKTCLDEIDRCYQDNVMPYFVNMTSERVGWIPLQTEVPQSFADEYRWVFGLSATEMEIVKGAYWTDNPNSIFLMREGSFIKGVPEEVRKEFIEEHELAPEKLKVLKKMISSRFPADRIVHYNSSYEGLDPVTNKHRFKLDENFRSSVLEFFKRRIEQQYPLYKGDEDPWERRREQHEAFMTSRGPSVLGRTEILEQIIKKYVRQPEQDVPLLILGQPGTGKSSIMAKAANDTIHLKAEIPGGGEKGWHVFHHFVGAVPGSTDLYMLLCRLLKELHAVDETSMPTDLDTAVGVAVSALNNPATRPVLLFVDALNQLDEDQAAVQCNWVPRKLPPNVRCVFSMINGSAQHDNLMARESKPQELFVQPLNLHIRKDIVKEFLGKFNKQLDVDQMFGLLAKEASENPLWLSIACEELRVFGNFRELLEKIDSLPDCLLDLLVSVLDRFEAEGGGHLLVATLCLIEVSTFGLLESELLTLLADEENLLPPDMRNQAPPDMRNQESSYEEKGEKDKSEKEQHDRLPAMKWAVVYRSLRPFLRPFGDSGEGRLDFYHRTLSKVVRKHYFNEKMQDEDSSSADPSTTEQQTDGAHHTEISPRYKWFHTKLAHYFEHFKPSDNYDRKVEEYPHHLLKLKDSKRLEAFLCEWQSIDRLYDADYSGKLLKYWASCGGFDAMVLAYSEMLQQQLKDEETPVEELRWRYEQMGRILMQAGQLDQSLALAEEALKLEMEKLGARKEKLADVYALLGSIWFQINKTKHEFNTPENAQAMIEFLTEGLSYRLKAVEILREFTDDKKLKHKFAKLLLAYAFSLASRRDVNGTDVTTKDHCQKEGEKCVEEAITILKETNDTGNIADALMSKAVLYRGEPSKQEKILKEAKEKCRQAYGEYHPLMMHIHNNMLVCYESAKKYDDAYQCLKRSLEVALVVYGKQHDKTKRAWDNINHAYYKEMAEQKGDVIPTLD